VCVAVEYIVDSDSDSETATQTLITMGFSIAATNAQRLCLEASFSTDCMINNRTEHVAVLIESGR
jgi:hypothetical protein